MHLKTFIMKTGTITLLIGSIFILSACGAEKQGYATINSTQLLELLNQGAKTTIIDLREPELYGEGHISGAINIPFEQFKQRMGEINPEQPVVFVCHTGPMGDVTSTMLVEQGFENVSNLSGGMAKWSGAVTK
jgi:rhodanese-related sulfurtransferase